MLGLLAAAPLVGVGCGKKPQGVDPKALTDLAQAIQALRDSQDHGPAAIKARVTAFGDAYGAGDSSGSGVQYDAAQGVALIQAAKDMTASIQAMDEGLKAASTNLNKAIADAEGAP